MTAPDRDALLADVAVRRERLASLRRRARWAETIGGWAIALAAAAGFRVVWSGGIFAMVLGATSWLLTAVVFVAALVVTRGLIATIAARRLVPARRELVAAESRLRARDTAFGRDR